MKYISRMIHSFCYSAIIATICLTVVELIMISRGYDGKPVTNEFLSRFPSETLAYGIDILLYGLYGAAFGGMSFIFEKDRIGFVLQNVIYVVATSCVWVPVVVFMWQLHKYPSALISTVLGFVLTYVIITVLTYRSTRRDIAEVNRILGENSAKEE